MNNLTESDIKYLRDCVLSSTLLGHEVKKGSEVLRKLDKALSLGAVMPRFSNDELKKMCNEMLFQIRGNYIEEHEQCEEQGHSDWQIAMYYFRKLNGA